MNRKTKYIREVNAILESRYLREQAPAPAPAPATPQQPVSTTTTTIKISDLPKIDCPNVRKQGLVSGATTNDYIIFNLDGKPFCKKKIEK